MPCMGTWYFHLRGFSARGVPTPAAPAVSQRSSPPLVALNDGSSIRFPVYVGNPESRPHSVSWFSARLLARR